MPPALLIIADDLTGANDTGVQFAKQGIRVIVSIHHEVSLQALANDCQVLVVNTESRHLSFVDAYRRVVSVVRAGIALGVTQFYKKTDSTLRGNIGAELAAVIAATGESQLFFAPAYPKLKRTTQQGIQFVDGIPLSQSTFAADLLNPLRQDFIPALIAGQNDIAARLFTAPTTATNERTIYVLDAQSDDDLRRAAQLLKDKKLLAGSAGFAEFLAEAMSVFAPPTPLLPLALPMLVVSGSLHEVSLRQIAHAARNGWAMFDLAADFSPAQVVAALTTGQRALLTTSPRVVDDELSARLAELVSQIFEQIAVGTLFVFGGDTLAAIAAARGWTAFRPLTEFLPGVPLVEVGGQDTLQLLTKAGGFGSEELLSEI